MKSDLSFQKNQVVREYTINMGEIKDLYRTIQMFPAFFLDKLSFSSTCVEQNLTCPTPEEASNELSWDLQTFAQRLENLLYSICHFLNLVLFTIVFMHFLNVCHCILYNATLNS